MSYTLEEKLQLVKWIYAGNSYTDAQRLFTVAFEGRPTPARSTILRIVQNFERTGSSVPCRSRSNELQNGVNGEREARNVFALLLNKILPYPAVK